MIVVRETRRIEFRKMSEYIAQYAKIEARYKALGMPPVTLYRKFGSPIIVADREWESMAALEAAGPTLRNDPELNALRPALFELVEQQVDWEFYSKV